MMTASSIVRPGTVATIATRGLLDWCEQCSVPRPGLLSSAGLTPAAVAPGKTLPIAAAARLWSGAGRAAGDDALALHVAQRMPIGAYGTYDFLVLTAGTLRHALQVASRYHRLVNGSFEVHLVEADRRASLELTGARGGEPGLNRYAEFILANALIRLRFAMGVSWRPREVDLTRDAPADRREHVRIFQSRPRFGRDSDRLVFDSCWLDHPLRFADPALHAALQDHASRRLEAGVGACASDRLRRAVGQMDLSTPITLSRAARDLGASARTLQRLLAREGRSFSSILDDVRRELALTLVGERRLSGKEASTLVGYAEPTSLYRALRRWRGGTRAAGKPRPRARR